MLTQNILKVRASKIARNAYISIKPEKMLLNEIFITILLVFCTKTLTRNHMF